MNQCLHNISGSHGGPHANLLNFTFLLVDFTNVLCSSANELQQNSNASSRIYSTNFDCFVRDSSRLHLSFVTFCLVYVIRNNSVDQSALLTGFRTDFACLSLSRRRYSSRNHRFTIGVTYWFHITCVNMENK